ncbi:MAG: Sulfurtransferase [Chlamydiae bacterium]|nr:Sulfurtransferase [Chlamydiota bacterium]
MDHSADFSKLVAEAKQHIEEIGVNKLNKLLKESKKLVLIDVRESDEWFSGYIPSAIHLPRGILERDIENLVEDKNSPLVLYCGGGYRSALSCYNLQKMGFSNVLSLAGGIRSWRLAKLPLSN